MVIVCEICGVVGFSEHLMYCNQCHHYARHRYCLDAIPDSDDDDVTWSCEPCASSAPKQSSLNKLSSHPPRRSKRAKKPKSDRAAKIFRSPQKREKSVIDCLVAETEAEVQTSDVTPTFQTLKPCVEGVLSKPEQLLNDCSLPSEDNRSPHSCSVNSDRDKEIKRRRRLIIEDGEDSSDEEVEYVKIKQLEVDLNDGAEKDITNCLVAETEAEVEARTSDVAPTFQNWLHVEGTPLEPEQRSNDCSPPIEDNRSQRSCSMNNDRVKEIKKQRRLVTDDGENHDDDSRISRSCSLNNYRDQEIKKQRRLIIDDVGNCGEEVELTKFKQFQVDLNTNADPLSILPNPRSLEYHKYVYAQPIIDPSWRGWFDMSNEKSGTVVAHLSSKACLKAFEQASSLPPLLCMETHPRLDTWPKSFSAAAPTDENIALFFFPGCKRDEQTFDDLVQQIIDFDLALKAVIDNVELLVFPSCQLPPQYWRFRGKSYLWGVFRGRQVSLPHIPTTHVPIQSNSTTGAMSMSISMSAVGSIEGSDTAKSQRIRSPLSPLSASSGYRSDSPHSPLPPKSKIYSSEFETSHYCKPVTMPGSLDTSNKQNNSLSTPYLNLFPLEVEDIAIISKVGNNSDFNLDLGL